MPQFQHAALKKNAKEIRLLSIQPGKRGERIQVSIQHESLAGDKPPKYEALSYVWGSEENPVAIHVGTDELNVTQSLFGALLHLRDLNVVRTVWADAVCINQANVEEKSHQVGMMGDIFRLSERVIVWLGEAKDESDYALLTMEWLGLNIDIDYDRHIMKPSAWGKYDPHWADRTETLPYEERELMALHLLTQRPWFERLWVRQEIGLTNEHAIVMCGTATVPWPAFSRAIFALRNKARRELLGIHKSAFAERIEMIFRLTDMTMSSRQIPLARILRQTMHCKCTDPRDRVYAVLGLLRGRSKGVPIVPNYNLTKAEIYTDLVVQHMVHFQSLEILVSAEMRTESSNMPSWVPDWSVESLTDPLEESNAAAKSYTAANYLGNGILSVSGVLCSKITQVVPTKFHDTSSAVIMAVIRVIAPFEIYQASYVSGGSLLDAFCRTLCCGSFGDNYPFETPHLPKFEDSKNALIEILRSTHGSITSDLQNMVEKAALYLDLVYHFCSGRSLFRTESGHIGLGPRATKVDDEVCIILGCSSPLVMRPVEETRHRLVGECFVSGIMSGEFLLGPIPEPFKPLWYQRGPQEPIEPAFINILTKKIQTQDPRLDEFAAEGSTASLVAPGDGIRPPSCTPESLRARGLSVRNFLLE